MNCPHCTHALPSVTDPTLRTIPCPGCGEEVDLALTMEGTREISLPAPDPLIGRSLGGGRYRIDSLLGRGGMGTVYRGMQVSLDRLVAIKVLAPELTANEMFIKRFRREAGTLAAIEHPNIVTVHDTGSEDGIHYIVMAHVAGPEGDPMSLRDLLRRGTVEPGLALRIAKQVAEGLHHAHERGVVHRDIKPGNILLDGRFEAHVADFGIARMASAGGEDSGLTVTGSSMGTLRYMAPEQKIDAARADARSDVYALGAVLYEMLVGEPPEGRFDLPSQVDPRLDRRIDGIVERALRPDPAQRFATAEEMGRALDDVRRNPSDGTEIPVIMPVIMPTPTEVTYADPATMSPPPPVVPTATPTPTPPPPATPIPPAPAVPPPPAPGGTPVPATPEPTMPAARKRRFPIWIPVVAVVVIALVVVGILVDGGDDDEPGSGAGSGTEIGGENGGGMTDPGGSRGSGVSAEEMATRRAVELRAMLARKSPPTHAWFDARWQEIGRSGDPATRTQAEAALHAVLMMIEAGSPSAALDYEPPSLRGDPEGVSREYSSVRYDDSRLERTIQLGSDLAILQFSYAGKGRHYVLAASMRRGAFWFCRVYTRTDRPAYELYPEALPRMDAPPRWDLLASPASSMAYQLQLLRAGRWDDLRACFIPGLRNSLTDQLLMYGRSRYLNVLPAQLIQNLNWLGAARPPLVQIIDVQKGIRELHLIDGRWYSSQIWFR